MVSVCRLKHYWSVHVECGGWGLMTVWNRRFISPGLCSREPRRNKPFGIGGLFLLGSAPESPGEINPSFQTVINPQPPHST